MVEVPLPKYGRNLKYAYDEVCDGYPIHITVSNKDKRAKREYDNIRSQVTRYGQRHGKNLVTRLVERMADGSLKLEIHYNGKRKHG